MNAVRTDREVELLQALGRVENVVALRLTPALEALYLLSDAMRVLTTLADVAQIDKGLEQKLNASCDAWCNPISLGGGGHEYGVIANLAWLCSLFGDEVKAAAGDLRGEGGPADPTFAPAAPRRKAPGSTDPSTAGPPPSH